MDSKAEWDLPQAVAVSLTEWLEQLDQFLAPLLSADRVLLRPAPELASVKLANLAVSVAAQECSVLAGLHLARGVSHQVG